MKEIEGMREEFERAFRAVSFHPETRAEQCVQQYSAQLSSDLAGLENQGNYKEKYLAHLSKCTEAKSRTMSSMITGSGNFPVYRNQKMLEREMRAWEEFERWRERYIKRANAVRTPTPEEEIDDALMKLEKAQAKHQQLLDTGKILRSKETLGEKKQTLFEIGLSEQEVEYTFKNGLSSHETTYARNHVKRLEEKLAVMRSRIERRDNFERIEFDGGYIDIENDRVIIKHDSKPEQEVINHLKSHAFKWSPKFKSWCRKHTANALRDAKRICEVEE